METAKKDPRSFLIHHFASASSSTSETLLREQGRNVLLQGFSGADIWRRSIANPSPTLTARASQFVYTPAPPRIPGARLIKLKEWGTPIDQDEIYGLQDLTDFTSTEFSFPLKGKHRPSSYPTAPPAKKRKLNHDSLTELIPQPHILPSRFRVSSRQVNISPYKKSAPIMIPPYTLPLKEFDEWTRCTWIIPVRGKLPWPESTSSALLESCDDLPTPPTIHSNEVIWTTTSIIKFWEFLVDLQGAGNLGSLGLSYYPVVSRSSEEKTSRLTKTSLMNAETSFSTPSCISLTTTDHIKIYHDWTRTFRVRTILDSWSFVSGKDKIRLFIGARLVLLDEKSRGVMIL